MGAVYRATSPRGQVVAVKVLQQLSPDLRTRFSREERLMGSLGTVDGFVPFVDSGDSEAGPFVVMLFILGGTLRDRLRRGPLAVRETVELGARLATALGRAHER